MQNGDALLGGASHPQWGGKLTVAPSSGSSPPVPGLNSATGSIEFLQDGKSGPSVGVGAVSWSLYQIDEEHWQLNGAVANPQTQAAVGSIELQVTTDGKPAPTILGITGKMSDDVEGKLTVNQPTPSYWATIPGCDVATGNYIQTAVQNAARQTFNLMVAPGLFTQ
jgi:hypothetical protein